MPKYHKPNNTESRPSPPLVHGIGVQQPNARFFQASLRQQIRGQLECTRIGHNVVSYKNLAAIRPACNYPGLSGRQHLRVPLPRYLKVAGSSVCAG